MSIFLKVLAAISVLSFLGAPTDSNAAIITFDDLPSSKTETIANGGLYEGLYWLGFYSVNPLIDSVGPGGVNAVVSGSNIAYVNPLGLHAIYSPTPFTLNGGYFSVAYDSVDFYLIGSLGGTTLYYSYVSVSDQGSTYVSANWTGIDMLYIYPAGITGPSLADFNILIDDLDVTFSNVPLPAALPLFAAGLAGLGLMRKKKA
ncbi:MAG: VPLPA-CTERM sorting domain-containing protein [Bdellovibrionales bacterium]